MTPPKINTADGEFVKFCRKSDKFGYTYSFFPCFSYLAPETTANMPGRRLCRRKRNLPGNNPSEGGTTRKQDSPGTGVPENRIAAPGWADAYLPLPRLGRTDTKRGQPARQCSLCKFEPLKRARLMLSKKGDTMDRYAVNSYRAA